tara:strand:- start:63231 stop:64253 length:1023 start_codon:yes stop_codon:yes gene_type:complete
LVRRSLNNIATRFFGLLGPENAHDMAIWLLANGLVPNYREPVKAQTKNQINLMGLSFRHPLGLAAGFDKDAKALAGLFRLGFSFIEAGTVTPLPQSGNIPPRLFRLRDDRALINRMGFNSVGLEKFSRQLDSWREHQACEGDIVGVNIGANKDTEDKVSDYVLCLERLANSADYITVNISSPNTPGLKGYQKGSNLNRLLEALTNSRLRKRPSLPILLKVSPDLDEETLTALVQSSIDSGIKGLIIGNTTINRPSSLTSRYKSESGGLSGRPLRGMANESLKIVNTIAPKDFVLIAVGGIANSEDVRERFSGGASLVQVYTEFVYRGVNLIEDILADLDK